MVHLIINCSSHSEHETPFLLGRVALGPADSLAVGDHLQHDGQLLEHVHHVPVELGRALQVAGPPGLPDSADDLLALLVGAAVDVAAVIAVVVLIGQAEVGEVAPALGGEEVALVGHDDHGDVGHFAAFEHLELN